VVDVRIESVAEPLARSPRAVSLAFGLLARAQVMGLLPEDIEQPMRLDAGLLARIADEFEAAGVATHAAARLRLEEPQLEEALEATLEALDASPQPEGEWEPARELLGDDLLGRILGGVSSSSIRRYATGLRETPDDVAWRLHAVARILASLIGSYNDYGIRRWFERRRSALGGKTPAQMLARARDEDDLGLARVLDLAGALVGAGAAT